MIGVRHETAQEESGFDVSYVEVELWLLYRTASFG